VPGADNDLGHRDTALPAELSWGALATNDGAAPSWNGTSCSGNYCHGSTLADGGATPVWTTVDGSQAACGSCHGLPPGGPHPPDVDCSRCHPNIDAGLNFIAPQQHIDGVVTYEPSTGVRDAQPTRFALRQCVPNPFNPTTMIRYDLPASCSVTLRIFDVTGRMVRRLVDDDSAPAGSYEVQWDGRDDSGRSVATGVYFYQIQAGSHRETKRMVLVK